MTDKPFFSAFAPASIGNFIVGFDVLGLAIAPVDGSLLGDQVTVEPAEHNTLTVTGTYRDRVPQGEDNLVYKAAQQIQNWLSKKDHQHVAFSLTLQKNLPVGSGTGSSAASVVAAIQALTALLDNHQGIKIPMADRWQIMAMLEGGVSGAQHLDNIAPAVLGGLVLCPEQGNPQQLPFFDDWHLVLAFNGQQLLTRDSRACLPPSYPKAHTIAQMQRMAAVVDGLYRQDQKQVLLHLQDCLAEPYRAELISGYRECRAELLQQGALAVGISGAGPSFFAVCRERERAQSMADWLRGNMPQQSGSFVHVCKSWYPK